MRFDVVRFTCGMKSIMIAAMFNVGTSGTIPAIAPKGNVVTPGTHVFSRCLISPFSSHFDNHLYFYYS